MTIREQKLQQIIESEKILNAIQDIDILLERLLTEARNIVKADAGSIYVYENNVLSIRYAQNDTQQKLLEPGQKMAFSYFSFEVNERSISGYSVLTGDMVNVPDAYNIPPDKPYKFNKQPDALTGYTTHSMLAIPLISISKETLGVLQIINALDENGKIIEFDADAELYLKHFAASATQALERTKLTRAMIMRMINMAGLRDPKETGAHVNRVSSYAVEIYDRWAFSHKINVAEKNKFRDNLKIAAMLHDVGKVGIPDAILKLPRRFTEDEYNIIKTHPYIGAILFDTIESPLDIMSLDVVLHHHERWDGSGYPGKIDLKTASVDNIHSMVFGAPLVGTEIPLAARIVALADVYDALTSKRVYKIAWEETDVLNELNAQSGRQFDPSIINAFMGCLPLIRRIRDAWPE